MDVGFAKIEIIVTSVNLIGNIMKKYGKKKVKGNHNLIGEKVKNML